MDKQVKPTRIVLAVVAGAHGVRGEVRLKLFGEGVDALRGRTVEIGGRAYTVAAIRAPGVARLDGFGTREAAEALRGSEVSVDRADLPPLAEGEYYHADLLGLPCVGPDGAGLGTVASVENYGAGDLLEIERPDGARALVPYRAGVADLDGGVVRIDPAFLA